MTAEQTKEYLGILVDMEKNLYIQKTTINRLNNQAQSLGIKKKFELPVCYKSENKIGDGMISCAIIGGLLAFIIGTIATFGEFWDNAGIFAIIMAPLKGLFWAMIAALAGGLIVGPIVGSIMKANEQSEYDKQYRSEMRKYDCLITSDEQRVKNEIIQRNFILNEIQTLLKQKRETENNLNKLYDNNILYPAYKHDFVAICSFYDYYCKGRTYSLSFHQKTGDEGAYNIYENEKRLGMIIGKLDDVLYKLDEVIHMQYSIASALKEANSKISHLSNNVTNMSKQLSSVNSSINQQTAIEAYNSERIQTELRYMNTMNTIYSWH